MADTVGRFAPTPSGRMHLGNLYCALMAWLSARSKGGMFLLRIEDLDAARCNFAGQRELVFDDLRWLGIDWDGGEDPSCWQSNRTAIYEQYFEMLRERAVIYPCYCSRSELHAASAPHLSDGQPIYSGRCYAAYLTGGRAPLEGKRKAAMRVHLPDETITFTDGVMGDYSEHLPDECGDFILRRSDGVFAYQFAVVIDDALSGVTEVVRGADLLTSTARQIWLYRTLGFQEPTFYHLPLITDAQGNRLAKRDRALDAGALRGYLTAEELVGAIAYATGQIDRNEPISARELLAHFDRSKLPKRTITSPI